MNFLAVGDSHLSQRIVAHTLAHTLHFNHHFFRLQHNFTQKTRNQIQIMATLPSKRSPMSPPDGSASPKKSKADKKRESISRAQQWAAERKRKQEGGGEDDAKKIKHEDEIAEGEERDVLENLPSPTKSTRSKRSNRGADDASHASEITESSVGSRRSSRLRTVTTKAASAASSSSRSKAAPRKGRKSEAPPVEETAVVKEQSPEREEELAEIKAPTPKKATPIKGVNEIATDV